MCNQSSAKAHGSRTMSVPSAVSKEEAIGKFYPLCVQLLSGAMGIFQQKEKRQYGPCPWKTVMSIFGKGQQHLQRQPHEYR